MKKRLLILGIILLLIGGVGAVIGKPYYDLHFSKIDLDSSEVTFYINSGSNLEDVANVVENAGILDGETFLDFANQLDFTNEKVEPGKYKAQDGMKIKNLIYGLKNGNQEILDVRISFNGCKSIEVMAGKVAPFIEADSAAIVDYIKHPQTIEKYGFKEATIIAMFLPDTYEVGEWDMSAEEFVQFMADQYKAFWDDAETGRGSRLEEMGITQSQVTTLASIVEAEQGIHSQEWGIIAGVYLNRYYKGMRFEADPTAKYCWGDELNGTQRLLSEHMKIDCPYNTYIYAGFPPGPIRMPSKTAIDAVLNAEDHDYLYFCVRPDNSGLHNFAETYSQHLENARAWWRYADERGY